MVDGTGCTLRKEHSIENSEENSQKPLLFSFSTLAEVRVYGRVIYARMNYSTAAILTSFTDWFIYV